jgi:phosphoglycerate dehydrogenase-like enzyme
MPNVLLSPHSASITNETRAAMLARLARDLDGFLAGQPFHDATRD